MKLSVTSSLLCLSVLLSSIELLTAKPIAPQDPDISEELAISDVIDCKNSGQYNAVKGECDCKSGYNGRFCEKAESVKSQRCEVRSLQSRAHQHPKGCPSGMWCVADNINCFFYACRKTLGWCIPYAPKLGPDAETEESISSELMNQDPGNRV